MRVLIYPLRYPVAPHGFMPLGQRDGDDIEIATPYRTADNPQRSAPFIQQLDRGITAIIVVNELSPSTGNSFTTVQSMGLLWSSKAKADTGFFPAGSNTLNGASLNLGYFLRESDPTPHLIDLLPQGMNRVNAPQITLYAAQT